MKNKLNNTISVILISFIFIGFTLPQNISDMKNKESIQKVIKKAYIQGIHGNQDVELINSGFHTSFNMLVLRDNNIKKVDITEWLKIIAQMKKDNPELWNSFTTYKFDLIDITGITAVAKINVYKGQTHFSTDYMLLYKFDDNWKIVSKIYNLPKK